MRVIASNMIDQGRVDAAKRELSAMTEFSKLHDVSLSDIQIRSNVRTNYDEPSLSELAASIEKYGLIQPIVLIKEGASFILLAGHRRYFACKSLGWPTIKAIVRDRIDDTKSVQLIENIQREALSPADLEEAVSSIYEELGGSIKEVCRVLSVSPSWVEKVLRANKIRSTVDPELKSEIDDVPYHELSSIRGEIATETPYIKKKVEELAAKKASSPSKVKVAKPKNLFDLKYVIDPDGVSSISCSYEIPKKAKELLERAVSIIRGE